MLTDTQINVIRTCAERLAQSNIAATNAFYASLFEVAPGVRPLFPEDMFAQAEKLWNSIVMVVESVDDLSVISGELKALGARHVKYGARPEHYIIVTDVLVETIAVLMKDDWSADHHHAWKSALDAVSATMIEGAEEIGG